MTRTEFLDKWTPLLPVEQRHAFAADLAAMVAEHAEKAVLDAMDKLDRG